MFTVADDEVFQRRVGGDGGFGGAEVGDGLVGCARRQVVAGEGVGGVGGVQGEGFLYRQATGVGRGDGERDGFFCRVVEMLPGFEFQRAVAGDFKAVVAGFIGVRVAAVGVVCGQFADGRACPKARYEDGLDMAKNIGVYQPNLPFLFFGQEKTVNLF